MSEDNYIPDWFDAVLRIRFDSEIIVEELQKYGGIENPTADDVVIAIDEKLNELFGRPLPQQFDLFDSDGNEL